MEGLANSFHRFHHFNASGQKERLIDRASRLFVLENTHQFHRAWRLIGSHFSCSAPPPGN